MTVIMLPAPAFQVVVRGIAAPQGSKKGSAVKKNGVYTGRVSMRESSKKVKPWRDDVRSAALQVIPRGWKPLDGPLSAEIVFTMRKPLSAPKTRRTWPDRYPDISKLLRSTEDALTTAGIWADDARVVEYRRLAKVFPGEDVDALPVPGAVIRIWRIGDGS